MASPRDSERKRAYDREYSKRPEVKARKAAWSRKNRHRWARTAEQQRASYLKHKYGLTRDDYDALATAQGGGCGICRAPLPAGMRGNVDHCHETGRVRGLLCNSCNVGIGHLKHDPARLRAAIDYLTEAL